MKQFLKIIDGTSIALFRIGFGLFMLWEVGYLISIDFIEVFIVTPQAHFPYLYLEFLSPAPSWILYIILYGLLLCASLITIGRFYRIAIIGFFLGFSYLFLLDKAYYNNHLYLVCLVSFLLIFIPADNRLSLRSKKWGHLQPTMLVHIIVLRLQLALVYFFGGVAKLNYDWIFSKEPARSMLEQKASLNSLFADFLTSDLVVNFVVYGGVIFDVVIGFLLFVPRVRKWAIIAAFAFHLMNAFIFDDINIFPYFMILSLVLFLNTAEVEAYFDTKIAKTSVPSKIIEDNGKLSYPISILLVLFFSVQFLLPFRHFQYAGNTEWTGHGQRFAWRMKIQYRKIEKLDFKLKDYDKKVIYPTDFRSYGLNKDQINLISKDPYAAIQYARFLKDHARERKSIPNSEVVATILVSLNGRKPHQMFEPTLDLSALEYTTVEGNWVTPLTE